MQTVFGCVGAGFGRRAGRWIAVCALTISCVPLNGCAMFGPASKVRWRQVTLIAAADANSNSATAVDIVLIRDAALLQTVIGLSADQWFHTRADLMATSPGGLRYESVEMVPGQRIDLGPQAFAGPRVLGAMAFARYATPGRHAARVPGLRGRLVLTMGTTHFTVTLLR